MWHSGFMYRNHPVMPSTEPSFVFADVIQKSSDGTESEDDKVYFFFTEVSVEYEFVFKLMIPRVARVCKVSAPPTHSPGTDAAIPGFPSFG